ncbi:UNVERIFIED_CONTAM: hypothetical protein FKN15_026143 [Acipenser sinensis]
MIVPQKIWENWGAECWHTAAGTLSKIEFGLIFHGPRHLQHRGCLPRSVPAECLLCQLVSLFLGGEEEELPEPENEEEDDREERRLLVLLLHLECCFLHPSATERGDSLDRTVGAEWGESGYYASVREAEDPLNNGQSAFQRPLRE